jgi:hypothetical protein
MPSGRCSRIHFSWLIFEADMLRKLEILSTADFTVGHPPAMRCGGARFSKDSLKLCSFVRFPHIAPFLVDYPI